MEISDEGLVCTKAVYAYVHDTYGRFPATVDTMHLMWLIQAHHLTRRTSPRGTRTPSPGNFQRGFTFLPPFLHNLGRRL